jgi:hypothetical protein
MTIIQSDIKVKALLLGNGDESEKKTYLLFLPHVISTTVSVNILLEL